MTILRSTVPADRPAVLDVIRLKKWFVYQSTEKHDELKTSCFERVTGEGEVAVEIRFSL